MTPAGTYLAFNIMLEQWADGTAPLLGPMGNPLPRGLLDHQAVSWAAYGPRVGIWKILEALREHSVKASVYISGCLAEAHPDVVAAVAAEGHEICAHGWSQDVIAPSLSRAREAQAIADCRQVLTATSGRPPRGWISPRCTPSAVTGELLFDAGFDWWGDVFDAERPYLLHTRAGEIIALPFGMEVNDLPFHVRYGRSLAEFPAVWRAAVDALDGSEGHHLDVTLHAHVGGRPTGIAALREILAASRSHAGLRILTRGEIAAQAREGEATCRS